MGSGLENFYTTDWRRKNVFRDIRHGITINYDRRTIYVWCQYRTYFTNPNLKKRGIKKGASFDQSREIIERKREEGLLWLRYKKPFTCVVLSFRQRLPAVYKPKKGAGCTNVTWRVDSLPGQWNWNNIRQQLAPAACKLLGIRYNSEINLCNILRPTLEERFGTHVKMPILPSVLRPLINEPNFKDALKRVFGSKGKRTAKLVIQCMRNRSYYGLWLAHLFRGYLKIDDLHKVISAHSITQTSEKATGRSGYYILDAPEYRRYAKCIPIHILKRWISECYNINYLMDTLEAAYLVSMARPINWADIPRDLIEAHDVLYQRSVLLERDALYKIELPIPKRWGKLAKSDIKTKSGTILKISLPETMGDIYEWGDRQRHCIGAYATKHRDGEHILFQVADMSGNLYHGQVKQKRLIQFYGKCNQTPPEDIVDSISQELTRRRLVLSK